NNLAALDATTAAAAASWNPAPDGPVRTLAIQGTTVFVGGEFNNVGGQSRSKSASLDAATGNATPWNPSAGGFGLLVQTITLSGSMAYVGGTFTSIGQRTRRNAAAIDIINGGAKA